MATELPSAVATEASEQPQSREPHLAQDSVREDKPGSVEQTEEVVAPAGAPHAAVARPHGIVDVISQVASFDIAAHYGIDPSGEPVSQVPTCAHILLPFGIIGHALACRTSSSSACTRTTSI